MGNIAPPKVITKFIDKRTNCTIRCYAYRKLTIDEVVVAVDLWLRTYKRKSLPFNGSIRVITHHE